MEGKVKSVVLVGRTGNGKSATGNSILGKNVFKSMRCLAGVTSISEQHSAELCDGQILNVIDTPGLFDFSGDTQFIGTEIARCIDLANDGIHAIVLVLSIRARFSREEEAAVECLRSFFGPKIIDYMIVVFTGGDDLEDGETLEDFLDRDCPEPLKNTLEMCGNRQNLFNNKTKDEAEKSKQQEQFLSLVNDVVERNGGIPYTDKLFIEVKETTELREQYTRAEVLEEKEALHKLYEEKLKTLIEGIERKLKDSFDKVNQQLAQEQLARLIENEKFAQRLADEQLGRIRAEGNASTLTAQMKANEEIHKLELELQALKKGRCTIL